MQRILRILLPLAVLALGIGAWKWLGQPVEAPVPRLRPPQRLQTEVLDLQRTDYPVRLKSQGTVRAHHTTTLTPLVGGRIVAIHPSFEDGALFKAGEALVELDPADFKAALAGARARLARAEAALAQEEARAKQAKLNWEEIGYGEPPSELVLRVPQLREAHANVDAAAAEVDQATRDLERATVRAPFDGRVRARSVGLGQSVNPATPLGEVFATDFAEVRLPLTPLQIAFVDLPESPEDRPVEVLLSDALAGPLEHQWQARIVRSEGTLDESSRELFAIARIDDPFGIESGRPPLRIGQPVRALIEGRTIEDVFVIPRHALRGINRVQLIDEAELTLQRHDIEPVWSDDEVLVVRDGLEPGQLLAVSRLPYAPDGAPVEILGTPVASGQVERQSTTVRAGDS